MTGTRDERIPIDPPGVKRLLDELASADNLRVVFVGHRDALSPRHREPSGQSALPRFSPYNIPAKVDPKAVDCPYCVKRPRNLRDHCRSQHPDKPEAR